jgi:hypothetical protein
MQIILGSITGRPKINDDRLLLEVAWRVHVAAVRGDNYSLREVVRKVLEDTFETRNFRRGEDSENSDVRRLVSRFEKEEQEWLARASSQDDFQRMDVFYLLNNICSALEQWNSYVGNSPTGNLPESHKILFDRGAVAPTMASRAK